MEDPSNAELVRAVLAGNREAYGRLYDRYAPLVRAVCYDQTGNLADAQDLAQDVFVRAYERLGQLRKPESFGPWVVTMARLSCRDWRRRTMREQRREANIADGRPDSYESTDNGQAEVLRRAIARLPEKDRLALHVFYLQGNSTNDCCRIVGLSRSGFYRALDRAREQLRRLLAGELEDTR